MILGICGSPRNGATEYVIKNALNLLKDSGFQTEFFTVRGKKIGFCQHCDWCLANKECVIKDGMQKLYGLLSVSKGIIISTPVYNGGVSAQIKAIMDRCRALLAADPDALRYKVGISITVGGDRIGGQELAAQQINTFYLCRALLNNLQS